MVEVKAAKVHQATVVSSIRKMSKLNTGQQLNAQRGSSRDLLPVD